MDQADTTDTHWVVTEVHKRKEQLKQKGAELSARVQTEFARVPAKRNETYWQHVRRQGARGTRITLSGLGTLVNAVFPFWLEDVDVRLLEWLTDLARAVDQTAI